MSGNQACVKVASHELDTVELEVYMDSLILGILLVFGIPHLILIAVPLGTVRKSSISFKSKLTWAGFLIFLPFLGAAIFHFKFRSGLYSGEIWEPSAHDLGARNPEFHQKDKD